MVQTLFFDSARKRLYALYQPDHWHIKYYDMVTNDWVEIPSYVDDWFNALVGRVDAIYYSESTATFHAFGTSLYAQFIYDASLHKFVPKPNTVQREVDAGILAVSAG